MIVVFFFVVAIFSHVGVVSISFVFVSFVVAFVIG
jgi:hypothetical protein